MNRGKGVCALSHSAVSLWPHGCSLPSFSVHGIFQSRILPWIAISYSKEFSWPKDQTQVSCIACKFFTIGPCEAKGEISVSASQFCCELKTRSERDTCTPMFIAALFILARTWKQPRCPLADEWIRKLWYIYTVEYYSAIKKNSFESLLMRWMKLEPIIQSEGCQKDKEHYSILTHIYGI